MTAVRQPVLPAGQWHVAEPQGIAAPIRAVDSWRREATGADLRATVRVRVRGDDENLRGHFPGLAVFPGVFILEVLSQAMALAVDDERCPVLRLIESVRFLAPLLDGDELTLAVAAEPTGSGWRVKAVGTRQDGVVTARLRAQFDRGADHDA